MEWLILVNSPESRDSLAGRVKAKDRYEALRKAAAGEWEGAGPRLPPNFDAGPDYGSPKDGS